jgi:DNA polymerase I-like protein with 3'-5' exonuclease and polymerase domains
MSDHLPGVEAYTEVGHSFNLGSRRNSQVLFELTCQDAQDQETSRPTRSRALRRSSAHRSPASVARADKAAFDLPGSASRRNGPRDGRITPPLQAVANRPPVINLTSEHPRAQRARRRVRRAFIAHDIGPDLPLSADYSQID